MALHRNNLMSDSAQYFLLRADGPVLNSACDFESRAFGELFAEASPRLKLNISDAKILTLERRARHSRPLFESASKFL